MNERNSNEIRKDEGIVAQLIFLHIEKSSGTAQWALFDRVYGREWIFRRERDAQFLSGRRYRDIADRIVVGGHVTLKDFENSPRRLLFASIVREPVSRAVSLYHYLAENAPKKDLRIWKMKGLNPESMLRSINEVPDFREAIRNIQCFRLSGYREFSQVKKAFREQNMLVGHFGNISAFNDRLISMLNWPRIALGRHNTAKRANYQEEILAEPGLRERILELNDQDQQLYQYLLTIGLFENIPDKEIFRKYLGVDAPSHHTGEFSASEIRNIRLDIHAKNLTIRRDAKKVPVKIHNGSSLPLKAAGEHPIRIAYHWYDSQGQMVEWEGARTALPVNLFPAETRTVEATVKPPSSLPPGRYRIRFGLLELGKQWLDRIDDTHTVSATVEYIGR